MDHSVHNKLVSFIWNIADDCLRDLYGSGGMLTTLINSAVTGKIKVTAEMAKG